VWEQMLEGYPECKKVDTIKFEMPSECAAPLGRRPAKLAQGSDGCHATNASPMHHHANGCADSRDMQARRGCCARAFPATPATRRGNSVCHLQLWPRQLAHLLKSRARRPLPPVPRPASPACRCQARGPGGRAADHRGRDGWRHLHRRGAPPALASRLALAPCCSSLARAPCWRHAARVPPLPPLQAASVAAAVAAAIAAVGLRGRQACRPRDARAPARRCACTMRLSRARPRRPVRRCRGSRRSVRRRRSPRCAASWSAARRSARG
jgi:hypothetical protein